jgi:hypothetical protein
VTDLGRSKASQGFEATRSILRRNLKYELKQAIRAPTVVDDGTRPESPIPCAHAMTSGGLTSGGVLPSRLKSGHNMPA